jgi:autotransporter translocation and assembly factor TamB
VPPLPPRGPRGAGRAPPAATPAPAADPIEARLELDAPRIDDRRLERLTATLSGDAGRHALAVAALGREPALDAALRIEGGLAPGTSMRWSGRLLEAANARAPTLRLLEPAELAFDRDGGSLSGLRLRIDGDAGADARIETASWRDGRFVLRGSLAGVPARWLGDAGAARGLVLDAPDALRLAARVDLSGTLDAPRGRIELTRESGDLTVESPSLEGGSERLKAGLEALRASVDFEGDIARASAELRGATIGTVRARADAPWRTAAGALDRAAPLSGRVEVDLPSLAFARALAGDAWRFGGALQARLELGGTLGAPRATGRVTGERLVAEQRELGMRLTDGTLDAMLAGDSLDVRTLRFASGAGSVAMSGSLRARRAQRGGADARADARAARRRAAAVAVGRGARDASGGTLTVRGALRADEGVIELTGDDAPRLARDVTVARDAADAPGCVRSTGARTARGATARVPIPPRPAATPQGAAGQRCAGPSPEPRPRAPDRERPAHRPRRALPRDGSAWTRGSPESSRCAGRLPRRARLTGTVRIVQGTWPASGASSRSSAARWCSPGRSNDPAIDIVALRATCGRGRRALTGTAAPRSSR